MSTAQAPDGDDNLDQALAIAACGLRVLPIKPGQKRPPMTSWQHAASVDPKTITNWYRGLYKDCGVGIAMGLQPDGRIVFALDVDEHDPAQSGHDTLDQLEQIHGKLPDTVTSITGAGGAHLIYLSPVPVSNGAAGQVGPGLDVRGQGGQIVVAPTIHPNGTAYMWEDGCSPWECEIAEAPPWLLELVAPRENAPTEVEAPRGQAPVRSLVEGPNDSPADTLRQGWDWAAELAARGWQQDQRHPENWTRPGKDPREGSSAVLHGDDGPFVVFTTDASVTPMWRAGKVGTGCVSLSPLAFVAAYDHGGDLSAATRALRHAQGPSVVDLGALVAPSEHANQPGEHADPDADLKLLLLDWPTFWGKDHSEAEWIAEPIIPAKRSVALFAPGGAGKSLLALWLSAAIATGRPIFGVTNPPRAVLYLDYEMTEDDLHERLESMGYGPDVDLALLHYALLPSLPGLDEPEGGKAVVRLAEICGADLVIIDTFGRAVHGDENEADTVRAWYRWTGLHLKAAGRAFMRIDHAGKDLEKGQRGTSAKNDDVDVVWRLTENDRDMFTLIAKKRRMGWVPETVSLTKSEDDTLTYALTSGIGYPPGTADVAARLDELGVARKAGWRPAGEALRAAGEKHANEVVRAAVKYRKTRDTESPAQGTDKWAGIVPAHPSAEISGPPSGPPSPETPSPQVDDLRPTPRPTAAHQADATAAQCGPLRGAHWDSVAGIESQEPTREGLFDDDD